MTDTDVRGRLPAQPSTTDLNLWLVSRLKGEGSELTFGQIASIAKDLSAALRSPGGEWPAQLDSFDAGELNTYGGGNVEWWLDYIRALLGDAEQFYQQQYAALSAAEATSAPTPAPVSGEREVKHKIYDELHEWIGVTGVFPQSCSYEYELRSFIDDAFSAATALRTPHGLPGEEASAQEAIALTSRALEHLSFLKDECGKSRWMLPEKMQPRDFIDAILSRLTASREDGK